MRARPTRTELATIRSVLAELGPPGVEPDFAIGQQGFLRRPRVGIVGSLYKHDDGSWLVCVGPQGRGGFRVAVTGEVGTPVATVLRRAITQEKAPFGPPPTLEEELRARVEASLAALTRRRSSARTPMPTFTATDRDGIAFTWTPLYATETRRRLRHAFEATAAMITTLVEARPLARSRRRWRALMWRYRSGAVALWETDHDPGNGLQLLLARWKQPVTAALPPW